MLHVITTHDIHKFYLLVKMAKYWYPRTTYIYTITWYQGVNVTLICYLGMLWNIKMLLEKQVLINHSQIFSNLQDQSVYV